MMLLTLLNASSILKKYIPESDIDLSTSHDEVLIRGPAPDKMEPHDVKALSALGFRWSSQYECWQAFT